MMRQTRNEVPYSCRPSLTEGLCLLTQQHEICLLYIGSRSFIWVGTSTIFCKLCMYCGWLQRSYSRKRARWVVAQAELNITCGATHLSVYSFTRLPVSTVAFSTLLRPTVLTVNSLLMCLYLNLHIKSPFNLFLNTFLLQTLLPYKILKSKA